MNLKVLNPIDFPRWNESLLSLSGNSFFHTSSWAYILRKSYSYEPAYFALLEKETLQALLPIMEIRSRLTGKRGVSLPFTDYCEPIASDRSQFQEMFNAAVALGKKRKWKYLELRGGESFLQDEQPSECYYGHRLDLERGSTKLFNNMRDSTRRNVKKAEKEPIDVTISTSFDSMPAFCRLNAMTRREHGLPPQPRSFFDNLYEAIISRNGGFIAVAAIHNTAIAANVYLCFGDTVLYKYGASNKDFLHLRVNNLVMWKVIQWCCEKGYKTLCLGRTETDNGGLRQFKLGWGAREYPINYYKYDLQKDAFVQSQGVINPLFKKLLGRLPIQVLSILGKVLYRHIG